eukprot:4733905-Amphidinium_carterae.1
MQRAEPNKHYWYNLGDMVSVLVSVFADICMGECLADSSNTLQADFTAFADLNSEILFAEVCGNSTSKACGGACVPIADATD